MKRTAAWGGALPKVRTPLCPEIRNEGPYTLKADSSSVMNHVTTLCDSQDINFSLWWKGRWQWIVGTENGWRSKKAATPMRCTFMQTQLLKSERVLSVLWKWLKWMSERQGHFEGLLSSVESFWKAVYSTKGWAILHRFHTIVRSGWHPSKSKKSDVVLWRLEWNKRRQCKTQKRSFSAWECDKCLGSKTGRSCGTPWKWSAFRIPGELKKARYWLY